MPLPKATSRAKWVGFIDSKPHMTSNNSRDGQHGLGFHNPGNL